MRKTIEWKKDEWGRWAMVDGWLTLAVGRAGEEWFVVVAGAPLQDGRTRRVFATEEEACAAAEKCALERIDSARQELA